MCSSLVFTAILLFAAAAAPVLADPFADTKSKQEAVAAFADVEKALVKKDANGLKSLYESWKATYGIEYPTAEDAQRYANFVATVRRVIGNNKDARTAHWSALNEFSALSTEEFKARFTNLAKHGQEAAPAATKAASQPSSRRLLQTLPTYKNWAAEGKVSSVKNQGSCGCCWAFAGIAAIESRTLIALGKTNLTYSADLAEQQIVDCARGPGPYQYSYGCGGGQLEDPYRYAANAFAAPEALYPYKAVDGTCHSVAATTGRVKLSGTGLISLATLSATAFKKALLTSPFSIAFYASDPTFRDYRGGVYTPASCGSDWMVNHAVLLVGWKDAEKSWTIKNSWGASWGEKGFFRMYMKADGTQGTCQMYTWAVQPTAPALIA
ncbi:hypothetical protein N2152v2_006700 [Parachlorella kessleri]